MRTIDLDQMQRVRGGKAKNKCPPASRRFGISCSDWLDLEEERNDDVPGPHGGQRAPR